MQVRVVAFGEPATRQPSGKDAEAETTWCGEFMELQQQVAQLGGRIQIESAKGIGEVPLKVIAPSVKKIEGAPEQVVPARKLRQRTQD